MYIYDDISLNSSQNEKRFRQKLYKKSKHTFYVQERFSENRTVHEIKWKNVIQTDRPLLTISIRHMRFACWITKSRIHAQTHIIQYLLLSHGIIGYANASYCYVIGTLPVITVQFGPLLGEWR